MHNIEFVAGEVIYSLIGFTNGASIDFVVTAIEASFRYAASLQNCEQKLRIV